MNMGEERREKDWENSLIAWRVEYVNMGEEMREKECENSFVAI